MSFENDLEERIRAGKAIFSSKLNESSEDIDYTTKLTGSLSKGGQGKIYKGMLVERTSLRQQKRYNVQPLKPLQEVVIKFLHEDSSQEMKERFGRECLLYHALHTDGDERKRHIAKYFGIVNLEGNTGLVIEKGETTFAEIIRTERKSASYIAKVLDLVSEAATGLSLIHDIGDVHRDIKPENIIIVKGEAKLIDFGVAHCADLTTLTETGAIIGSPSFMSPEQIRGKKPDEKSDIFSLGTVLYEALTGELPFKGGDFIAIGYSICYNEHKDASKINPEVRSDLDSILSRCLAKDPEKRYKDVKELIADLKKSQRYYSQRASNPNIAITLPGSHNNKPRYAIAAAALVGAILLGGAAYGITEKNILAEDKPKTIAADILTSPDTSYEREQQIEAALEKAYHINGDQWTVEKKGEDFVIYFNAVNGSDRRGDAAKALIEICRIDADPKHDFRRIFPGDYLKVGTYEAARGNFTKGFAITGKYIKK